MESISAAATSALAADPDAVWSAEVDMVVQQVGRRYGGGGTVVVVVLLLLLLGVVVLMMLLSGLMSSSLLMSRMPRRVRRCC